MKHLSITLLALASFGLFSVVKYAASISAPKPIRSITVNVLPLERTIKTEYAR